MAKIRKIRMKARELQEANVSFISLVKRPANRTPFRIMKSDDDDNEETEMFNMSDLGLRRKTEGQGDAPAPEIAAIVVKKADFDTLKPKLAEAGFNVESAIDMDDTVVLKQVDVLNEEECQGVLMSPGVGVLVRHMKGFEPFGAGTTFDENLNQSGFMPGIMIATEALMDTLRNVLRSSGTQKEAKTKIGSALKGFSTHIQDLSSELPDAAFKLELIEDDEDEDETAKKASGRELKPGGEDPTSGSGATMQGPPVPDQMCPSGFRMGDKSKGSAGCLGSSEAQKAGLINEDGTMTAKGVEVVEKAGGKQEGGTACPPGLVWDPAAGKCVPKAGKTKEEEGDQGSTTEGDAPGKAAAGDAGGEGGQEGTQKEGDEAPPWFQSFATDMQARVSSVKDDISAVKDEAVKQSERIAAVEGTAKKAETAAKGNVIGSPPPIDESLGNMGRNAKKAALAATDTDPNQIHKSDDFWGGVLDGVVNEIPEEAQAEQ